MVFLVKISVYTDILFEIPAFQARKSASGDPPATPANALLCPAAFYATIPLAYTGGLNALLKNETGKLTIGDSYV